MGAYRATVDLPDDLGAQRKLTSFNQAVMALVHFAKGDTPTPYAVGRHADPHLILRSPGRRD